LELENNQKRQYT